MSLCTPALFATALTGFAQAPAQTGGTFSIVEYPLESGVLGAPPYTHANEDETSFVIEGEIGVMIGE